MLCVSSCIWLDSLGGEWNKELAEWMQTGTPLENVRFYNLLKNALYIDKNEVRYFY